MVDFSADTDSISLNSTGSCSDSVTGDLPPPMPPPKPPRITDNRLSAILKGLESIPYMTSPIPPLIDHNALMLNAGRTNNVDTSATTTLPLDAQADRVPPLEIHRVTLYKDPMHKDFGFSVSDGEGDSGGVFINKIRGGGPAERSGAIRPFDRILQVNDTSLQFLDCIVAVPLLLSAVDRIDLLLCRDPLRSINHSRLHNTITEEDEPTSIASSLATLKDSAV